MNISTYVQNKDQLQECIDNKITEIILEHIDLARFGKLSTEMLISLAEMAETNHIQVALEWDILMTESEFLSKVKILDELDLNLFSSIRVQDVGAMNYILDHTQSAMTLILETGHHNIKAIQTWVNTLGNRLEKIVLSIELSKDTLIDYCHQINCSIEFLIVGRILLFYTPRNLLSAMAPEINEQRQKVITTPDFLVATGESEESPHKGFPIVENRHGTFMFHIKRLFLLEHCEELKNMGIKSIRLDLRFDDIFLLSEMSKVILGIVNAKDFKQVYPHDVIKGYYNINKTDVLFKKLKNYRIQRKDDSYIGEVIEASKGNYMAITVKKNNLSLNDELKFITPEGKEMFCKVHFLKNSKMEDIKKTYKGQLCLINYFGGVWVKSQVYLLEK